MAPATAVKVQSFTEALAEKKINLETDTVKMMATNTAHNNAWVKKADLTEIAAGNGYAAGGVVAANPTVTRTAGKSKFDVDDPVITASGGAIAAFRYLYFYSDT